MLPLVVCQLGGLEALAIAASGEANITGVVAIESVAMREVPPSIVLAYIKSQLEKGKTHLDDPEFINLPAMDGIREPMSKREFARRIFVENRAYQGVYRSNLGMTLVRSLATDYPHIPVDLIQGERSLTTTPEQREKMINEFAGTSVNVEIMAGGTHSFADPNKNFVHLIDRSLQRFASTA